jgi:Glycosyl transferase family 2
MAPGALTWCVSRHGDKLLIRRVPSAPAKPAAVTAVIPAYNYARFLPDCVGSVLSQTGVEVRLLVIDDCSQDETQTVLSGLQATDPRITVIRHERNRGHIPSVNEGLELVDTEYVVKLDADDMLASGSLARATALLQAHPEVAFVYGRPQHFSGRAPRRVRAMRRSWTIWPGAEWVAARCQCADNAISQPEVVMRTESLRRVGSVCPELTHTSDLHLWLRLGSIGDVGRVNGPVQAYYRVHQESMQRTVHAGELFRFRARRAAFDSAFQAEAGALPGAGQLHDTFRQAIARLALDCACHRFDRGRTEANGETIEEFMTFALETWPAAARSSEWNALQRRRAVGAERAPRRRRFVAAAMRRRARMEFRRWRWRHTGEL